MLSRTIFAFVILSLFAVTAYGNEVVLLEEDFEGLTLGPSINEGVAGDTVWTDTPPDGWAIEDDLAAPGMPEWDGWAFASAEWWTQTAGDQERAQFTRGGLGIGTVAIADPDEWDDQGSPGDAGPFNSWLSTPAIDISGIAADSLVIMYDSSWRPEDTQLAELTVAFDGGEPVVLIRMDSANTTTTTLTMPQEGTEEILPDLANVNEAVEVMAHNPAGAATAVVTWAMLDATNDWWWAIDNVSIVGTAEASAVSASGKLSTVWGSIKVR